MPKNKSGEKDMDVSKEKSKEKSKEREKEKDKETDKIDSAKRWMYVSFVFIVLFIGSLALNVAGCIITGCMAQGNGAGVGSASTNTEASDVDIHKLSDNALNYINDYVLQGKAVATVDGAEMHKGLINLNFTISGQSFSTYLTKDGTLLFPSVIDLTKTPEIPKTEPSADIPKTEVPEVYLYTMAYCPYGNQAEDVINPVVEALQGVVEIKPHYVIYSNYGGEGYCLDEEQKYCSMHGVQELNEDVRELCIYKYQKDKYWEFVLDVNTACTSKNVDECWEAVAKKHGIDVEKIKTCQQDEALDLLAEEVALNKKYNVRGSPTLVINGVQYQGPRTPEGFKKGICSGFTTPPEECGAELKSTSDANPTGGCG